MTEQYYNRNRDGYIVAALLIVFVPIIPIAVLLLWPWPGHWKSRRDTFSERKSCESCPHPATSNLISLAWY